MKIVEVIELFECFDGTLKVLIEDDEGVLYTSLLPLPKEKENDDDFSS